MYPTSEQRSYPRHCLSDTHGFHQLLVGLKGRLDIEVEGRGAAVRPGSVCLIPAGSIHHYLGLDDGNLCRVLDLPCRGGDALERLFDRARFLSLPGDEIAGWNDFDLLARLAEAPPLLGPRLNLARLTRIVEANPAAPWSVASLASATFLSERQLRRSISAVTGLTAWQWLQRCRIQLATRMLLETPQSITAIALACGFQDGPQFSRIFRQWLGMSPREYRVGRSAGPSTWPSTGHSGQAMAEIDKCFP